MSVFPLSPCSDLETRQIKWISRADQERNANRPVGYMHWGVSAVSIAASFAEAHADSVKTPAFG